MHRSRLGGFIIDCEDADLEAAARFWGEALGFAPLPLTDTADAKYRALDSERSGLHVEVQSVDHPSRVHLDIETDDIEAEVSRLEGIGAKRIERIRDWVVMEAPTGQRFCVIPAATKDFERNANAW